MHQHKQHSPKVTRHRRARALNARGNVALTTAAASALFLASAIMATSRWTPLHTWMATALAVAATTALTCYLLAARYSRPASPRGDSPQVTHPPITPSLTPSEVRK